MPLRRDRCYVIAEAGSNHMGDSTMAANLIREAAGAGADACKFQLFRLEDILVDAGTETFQSDARTQLPPEWIPTLATLCREHNIDFLCTPFAEWAVETLDPHVKMWKIGSFEHQRDDIWQAVLKTGKPIIVSTGRGMPKYLDDTPWIIPLYCVSKYPASEDETYLWTSAYGMRWGFSDHTLSTVLPAFAVARGACVVEKHFTVDRNGEGPDQPHSLEPDELAEMIRNIRLAEKTCWRDAPEHPRLATFLNRRE